MYNKKKLKIAMLGSWGMNLPNNRFGGFETFITELAVGLVEMGHEVTVYCRGKLYSNKPETFRGVTLKYVNSLETKSLATLSGTLVATFDAVKKDYDLLFYVNVGMGFHCLLASSFGKRVILNVDGLDWERSKWGFLGKQYFRWASRAAIKSCNALVTDSGAIQNFYIDRFGVELEYIPYGTYVENSCNPSLLDQYGLKSGEYYLVVSRLVPENNPMLILRAFDRATLSKQLVIVGKPVYMDNYYENLRKETPHSSMFLGHINDWDLLRELFCNCYVYIHGHSTGGTNPALLNAMGFGCCVVAYDVPFNREVLDYAGMYFNNVEELSSILKHLQKNQEVVKQFGKQVQKRVETKYSWEQVITAYEKLFLNVALNLD